MKCSVNSCSNLLALSKVFLPCSSVSRLFISLDKSRVQESGQTWALRSGRAAAGNTHMMFSTHVGFTKMAMGCSWATWSLLMAFPDTSRMQCLP